VVVCVVAGFAGAGFDDAAVAALPPPQAATARAASGISAALATKVMGRLRVMSLLCWGALTLAAIDDYRIT
jgi:hypothetical protein